MWVGGCDVIVPPLSVTSPRRPACKWSTLGPTCTGGNPCAYLPSMRRLSSSTILGVSRLYWVAGETLDWVWEGGEFWVEGGRGGGGSSVAFVSPTCLSMEHGVGSPPAPSSRPLAVFLAPQSSSMTSYLSFFLPPLLRFPLLPLFVLLPTTMGPLSVFLLLLLLSHTTSSSLRVS